MNLKKDILYKFNFNIGNKVLTYTGTVISVEDGFLTFLDKFGKELVYNLNTLLNIEELQNGN